MTRIGEEISERLDIVPAEFFVHRHIYGKWACRCCQVLRQAPSVAEVIEGGIAASGFVAHTLISRFVDHLPYYRQETINARSGVHKRVCVPYAYSCDVVREVSIEPWPVMTARSTGGLILCFVSGTGNQIENLKVCYKN